MGAVTDPGQESGNMIKWIALHIAGTILAVLGALYLLADMNLLNGFPASTVQAAAMLGAGLVLDFWGVIEMRRLQLKRRAEADKRK